MRYPEGSPAPTPSIDAYCRKVEDTHEPRGDRDDDMKLRRRPGAFVAFVDSFSEETFLKLECDSENLDQITYLLFDSQGRVVADSRGPQTFPDGIEVSDSEGEVLLLVPAERDEDIQYRLYNSKGELVTCSDGQRTQIFGGVRIEGNRHLSGRPPTASKA